MVTLITFWVGRGDVLRRGNTLLDEGHRGVSATDGDGTGAEVTARRPIATISKRLRIMGTVFRSVPRKISIMLGDSFTRFVCREQMCRSSGALGLDSSTSTVAISTGPCQ